MSLPDIRTVSDAFDLRDAPVLRWGIIGPGQIAQDWSRSVRTFSDQQIVAVASRSDARGSAFAQEHGIARVHSAVDALCADPDVDAVYIATPHPFHAEQSLQAIAAGKPVLVEKPFAMSAPQAQAVADAAQSAGVFALEAMWSRFLPQMAIAADLIAAGAIGTVRYASADFSGSAAFDPASRLFDPALGGGALLDIGVYTLWFTDWVLQALAGHETVTVAGVAGRRAATGVDDDATVLLRAGAGHTAANAVARTSLLAAAPHTATILGEEGRIIFGAPFWAPSGFTLVRGDHSERWEDTTGMRGRDGLVYPAVAAARHIAAGRTEAPEHPLAATVRVLGRIDQARAAIAAG